MSIVLRPLPITEIKRAAFTEPLTETTRKMRRSLLIYSGIAIVLKIYNLKIKTIPALNLDVPENTPHLLGGVLAVIVAYMFIMFVVYIWQDLQRWWLEGNIVVLQNYSDLISYTRDDIHAIKEHIAKISGNADKQQIIDEIMHVINQALERIPKSHEQISSMARQYIRLTTLQWVRLIVLEVSLPLFVGIVALIKVENSLLPFIRSVFM